MSVFEEKKYFDKNRAQDGISIKNPLNPEHKTKLYTAKKKSAPIFCIYWNNIVNQSDRMTNYQPTNEKNNRHTLIDEKILV